MLNVSLCISNLIVAMIIITPPLPMPEPAPEPSEAVIVAPPVSPKP
jgi:hypothetical protein